MSQQQQDCQFEPVKVLNLGLFIISAMAEPYKLLSSMPGTRGISASRLHTLAGIFLGFPFTVRAFGDPETFQAVQIYQWAWTGMLVGAVLHQIGAFLRFRHNHRYDIGRPWSGGLEPVVVAGAAWLLWPVFRAGAMWLLVAYGCSTLQMMAIRARYALQVGRIRDGQRDAAQISRRM